MLKQPTNFAYNDLHSPPNGNSGHQNHHQTPAAETSIGSGQKQSMLEKFKLFNREKSAEQRTKQQQIAKRTSSSSGFSSAKSERSDSSLSLNEHQQQQAQPQPQTPTSSAGFTNGFNAPHRHSTGLMRKSESHSLRLSSKVKAPSQSPSTSNLSRLSIGSGSSDRGGGGTLKNPSKATSASKVAVGVNGRAKEAVGVPRPKQIPGSLKLEPRPSPPPIGSKTNSLPRGSGRGTSGSLASPGMIAKSNVSVNSSTGIPKPMAAIKGTSKISNGGGGAGPEEVGRMTTAKAQAGQQPFNASGYYVQNIPGSSNGGGGGGVGEKESGSCGSAIKAQIMNSMEVEIQDDSAKSYNNIINAVMGKSAASTGLGMTDSTNSSSTSTTGLYSNSSESSVIFRPTTTTGTSESGASDAMRSAQMSPMRNVIPNRKMDQFSQETKYNTAPMFKATTPAAMNGHQAMMLENGKGSAAGSPGMSLRMDEFRTNVTLPNPRGHRGQRQFTLAQPSYGGLDMSSNSGYLSDGDAFKKIGRPYLTAYNVDIENGYLSDGCNPNKHMMNVIRRRQMLPTTIEER